jgi:hypothetical protein
MGFFAYYPFLIGLKIFQSNRTFNNRGGETASTGIKKLGLHTEGLPAR